MRLQMVARHMYHFFLPSGLLSKAYCVSKLEMPRSENVRLSYQISHFLHKLWISKPNPLIFPDYEQWCGQAMEPRGGISVIY